MRGFASIATFAFMIIILAMIFLIFGMLFFFEGGSGAKVLITGSLGFDILTRDEITFLLSYPVCESQNENVTGMDLIARVIGVHEAINPDGGTTVVTDLQEMTDFNLCAKKVVKPVIKVRIFRENPRESRVFVADLNPYYDIDQHDKIGIIFESEKNRYNVEVQYPSEFTVEDPYRQEYG